MVVSKHSEVTVKALIAALKRAGFLVQRVKGSHHFLWQPDERNTVVPNLIGRPPLRRASLHHHKICEGQEKTCMKHEMQRLQ